MTSRTTMRSSEAGQDLVEYALILPLLLLLIFGMVEFSLVYLDYNTIANAAREGARAAIVPETLSCPWDGCRRPAAEAAARRLTVGLDPARLTVTAGRPSAATVRVQVTYDAALITAPIITALGGQDTITLRTVATMQRE